ncbi:bifunctional epoxide hydrolase 2-like isoform X1 [Gopherus flavomarginatus]|uniref:bifunctional epoxide hydrolase 2-like isoform X1 n=1 Tax=Gopherus flavomarginatus TaxID=286002 RepID=UPI0021CC44B1|nr:bifunctional epoxide hydrolase 2-like isoform X1 [Gopherus flavomarginatus]
MARRLVLFDLGGVLFTPSPLGAFGRYEASLALPRNFLQNVILGAGPDGPYARAMRGEITVSQLVSELEEDCKKFAASLGASLPETFSVAQVFEDFMTQGKLNTALLQAAVTLRNNGFRTCVLTNNWIDDGPQRHITALLHSLLRRHFDLVIESCRIGLKKPDPRIYEYALDVLKAKPQEVIFLDDIGANLKPAQEMGIATILVKDTDAALKELQDLCGIQLLGHEETLPIACDPVNVTHGYVPIKPGVQLHFVEMGDGPVVCLCHGFPESWFSWRYQIPALAEAGFRVLALDMKGYGDSTASPDIEEYSQEEICKDLVVFLDKLGISQAVFIGHDWGGAVVWNMSLFYPERVRAVAGLNTPFRPANPNVDVMEMIKSHPVFNYQLYFQEPGVAELELEKDLSRTFRIMIRSMRKEDQLPLPLNVTNVQERGGLLAGMPEDPPPSQILAGADLQYFIQQFKKSGFRRPLNWYRNMRANWQWSLSAKDRKILVPALMVTAGKDFVLHPKLSKGMEEWIPQLTRGHIEECGHWTQMESPAALNGILIKWLEDVHNSSLLQKISKL